MKKLTSIHTVSALGGALVVGLVLVVTSAARAPVSQAATSSSWPPHPRNMVLVEKPLVTGLNPSSPPVVDYVVPAGAYFVLTGVAFASGNANAFDLVDATTGQVIVSEQLSPQLQGWHSPTEYLGAVFMPGAQVAWQPKSTLILQGRILEGYLVLASQ